MNNIILKNEFKKFNSFQKHNFFERKIFIAEINNLDENKIHKFLKQIIFDESEEKYIRELALESYIELVFNQIISKRRALSLLIDDWYDIEAEIDKEKNTFLNLKRLRKLFLFYSSEKKDIEEIFLKNSNSDNLEISTLSNEKLGLIKIQKAILAKEKNEAISYFEESCSCFRKSMMEIENQVNHEFYLDFSLLNLNFLKNNFEDSNQKLINNLSKKLFTKQLYNLNITEDQDTNIQFYFFKMVDSVQDILNEKPNHWLDFEQKFNEMYINFCNIQYNEIEHKIYNIDTFNNFESYNKKFMLNDYFNCNFQYEKKKIEILLNCEKEKNIDKNQIEFLEYVNNLLGDNSQKKNFR
ncbi:hypothetical protein [Aureivirga marina]|uniref:hypothetical protein n=1 Tax=Aureivirga marina TaxID=1182451 RepID=UPI0018C96C22|nr:hypothetical protein [Aureivirga marina]